MFPNLKEVVLVRDLRDVACSAMSSNGLPFDQVVEDTATAASQVLAILAEDRPSTFVLKYEDVVLDKSSAAAALFKFLGLSSIVVDEQSLNELFAAHSTSPSAAASIGRWRHALTADQKRKCAVFGPFLDRCGYSL